MRGNTDLCDTFTLIMVAKKAPINQVSSGKFCLYSSLMTLNPLSFRPVLWIFLECDKRVVSMCDTSCYTLEENSSNLRNVALVSHSSSRLVTLQLYHETQEDSQSSGWVRHMLVTHVKSFIYLFARISKGEKWLWPVRTFWGSLTFSWRCASHYNALWSSSFPSPEVWLSSCLLVFSSSWESEVGLVGCDWSLAPCSLPVSSLSVCRASVLLSSCSCDPSILTDAFSFLPSSLLPSRQTCLRIVRLCLLRRDWLQCSVRLRCHWLRDCWASTLSWRAASRGRKLLM